MNHSGDYDQVQFFPHTWYDLSVNNVKNVNGIYIIHSACADGYKWIC